MDILELTKIAQEIRIDIIKMLSTAKSGHSAGPLGMAHVFAALYFEIMNIDPQNPLDEDRDRFFLSNGHICPLLYATLAHRGFFPKKELLTLRKFGSRLQGHPERGRLLGIESTSGPLGSGLAQASGYAYCAKADNKNYRIYCATSDGEHQEGNHWEAVMFAAKYKLSNLTVFVDRNFIQIDGFTEDVMPIDPLTEKYKAFNFNVLTINGHDMKEIIDSVKLARACFDKPTVIICYTKPGYGVSFMENKYEWHGKVPNESEAIKAIKELKEHH